MTAGAGAPTNGEPDSERLDRGVLAVAGVVIVGAVMAILDITVVNVALDRLARDFDASLATIQWVVTGYTLALVAVIPATGWAADRFGTKRLYMGAVALFVIGSGLTGAAQSVETLIIFRVLQGLGGGMIMPLVLTMLTRAAGPARLGRVMSVIGVPMLLGPIGGPILGGWLVDEVSWRWIFYINLPVGLIALLLAAIVLPKDEHTPTAHLDVLGLLLLSPGLAAFVYGAAEAATRGGFDSAEVYVPGGGGLVLVALFVLRALTARHPLIDLRLFANRTFAASATTMFLFAIAFFGALLLLPLYFQTLRRESALDAGLLMAPQGLGAMLTMPLAGRFTDRVGAARMVLPGLLVIVAALGYFTQIGADTSYWAVGGALFVTGLGLGMAMMPIMSAAMATLSHAAIARASTTMNIVQQTGASIGTAMLSVVLASELADRLPGGDGEGGGLGAAQAVPTEELDQFGGPMADAFGVTFVVSVILIALALLPALLLPRRAVVPAAAPVVAPEPAFATTAVAPPDPHGGIAPAADWPADAAERSTPMPDVAPEQPTPAAAARNGGLVTAVVRSNGAGEAGALAGAVVSVLDPAGSVTVHGVTDADGRFAVSGLAAGAYTLAVSAPGHVPSAATLVVGGDGQGGRAVTLAAAATIAGQVVGGVHRRPVAEAAVSVRDGSGRLIAATSTDDHGGYRVDGLPHGSYVVTITGFPARTQQLDVRSGDDLRHDVTLGHDGA